MSTDRVSIGGFSLPLGPSHDRSPMDQRTPQPAPRPASSPATGGSSTGRPGSIGGFRAAAPSPRPRLRALPPPVPPKETPAAESAAGSTDAMPWHYQVSFVHDYGNGHVDVNLSLPITSAKDIDYVTGLVKARTGRTVVVTTYSLLSAPARSGQSRSQRRLQAATSAADPDPWHYWLAYTWEERGGSGFGACELRRPYELRTSQDLAGVTRSLSKRAGREVRITAHTLMTSPGSN